MLNFSFVGNAIESLIFAFIINFAGLILNFILASLTAAMGFWVLVVLVRGDKKVM